MPIWRLGSKTLKFGTKFGSGLWLRRRALGSSLLSPSAVCLIFLGKCEPILQIRHQFMSPPQKKIPLEDGDPKLYQRTHLRVGTAAGAELYRVQV